MADREEWNQVKRKGGRLRNIPAPTNNAADSLFDSLRPNPNLELAVDDLWQYHETVTKDSQTCEWWKQVQHVLDSASSTPNRPAITKAVCLGPGPYEPANGSSFARRTAHLQTAAFCFIVDHLSLFPLFYYERYVADEVAESQNGHDIKCVVQEPRFTQTDKEFCAKLGLEAVDSPEAFSLVDESTLVFGIHMELEIYNQALVGCPAMYVGGGLEQWEEVLGHRADSKELLASYAGMELTCDCYPLPDLDYMFSSTVMYWRRGKGQGK